MYAINFKDDLGKQIEWAKGEIKDYKDKLDKAILFLEALEGCTQPTIKELYASIESFFDVESKDGTYTHVLGGDGRSAPWDEERKGKILNVKIKDQYYLDQKQINIIKGYISNVYEFDKVNVISSGYRH